MSEGRRSQRLAKRAAPEPAAPPKRAKGEEKSGEPAPDAPAQPPADAPAKAAAKPAEARAKAAEAPAKAAGPLAVGAALPDVTLLDQDGEPVHVASLTNAVLFTYPRANTPGCTKQAQTYRDEYQRWTDAGFAVYGLSSDMPRAQKTWATKLGLAYRLLSAPERVLIAPLTGVASSTKRRYVAC